MTFGELEVRRTEGDKEHILDRSYLHFGPNSVDVTLGDTVLRQIGVGTIDPLQPADPEMWVEAALPTAIKPGDFWLGYVRERFIWDLGKRSPGIAGRIPTPMIDGRSTVGRLGIGVHVTAGFGDVGFDGNFTLELTNVGTRPVLLHPGMRIAQVFFDLTETVGLDCAEYVGAYSSDHIGRPVPPLLGPGRF
jgi:dCTP deaminase